MVRQVDGSPKEASSDQNKQAVRFPQTLIQRTAIAGNVYNGNIRI
jgi:hypothetical protein